MDPLKIAIVEDEMINAETLRDMLEDSGYEVTGTYMRAKKALEAFEQDPPDFALLDIQLKGEETGIWLAQQIRDRFDFPFIFLTSFGDKKTVEEAANTHPYGFLMKPVEKQNVYASIQIAMKKFQETQITSGEEASTEITDYTISDALFVKDEYYFTKLKFDEILFVKANGNYLEVHTENKKVLIKGTLGSFAESLPFGLFFQSHRSYLINLKRTDGFGASTVKIGKYDIPLSKTLRESFTKQFKTYIHSS